MAGKQGDHFLPMWPQRSAVTECPVASPPKLLSCVPSSSENQPLSREAHLP
jgi:hypothetical protein